MKLNPHLLINMLGNLGEEDTPASLGKSIAMLPMLRLTPSWQAVHYLASQLDWI